MANQKTMSAHKSASTRVKAAKAKTARAMKVKPKGAVTNKTGSGNQKVMFTHAWWGEGRYGENNYGWFTQHELTAASDKNIAVGDFCWDESSAGGPFYTCVDVNFDAERDGDVVFDANDYTVAYPAGAQYIAKLTLRVAVAVRAMVKLYNATAVFWDSSGATSNYVLPAIMVDTRSATNSEDESDSNVTDIVLPTNKNYTRVHV